MFLQCVGANEQYNQWLSQTRPGLIQSAQIEVPCWRAPIGYVIRQTHAWGGGMLIAVEGCVGVGKTTVAKGLATLRGSKLLLEDFESNPFLRAFYKDPIGNAIETEFAFLLLHF